MSTPPSAPHSLQALRERYGERYRWRVLMAVMVGTMASIMSSTIVNVAVPDLSQHFALGQDRAQWVTSGFMAAMTASMLTTPWLLARFGYRGVYSGCMWLLLAGGVVGGLAQHYPLVLAARVAEGLAAGVVQPIPAIIILRAFQPHEQGRASGVFGMGVVLAPALGPSLGGVLVDLFGWRSIFYMVVPFCLASLWLSRRYVPTSAPGGSAPNQAGTRLDLGGLALASAGTVLLLNGLVDVRGASAWQAALLLGAAASCWLAFVVWQRHQTRHHRAGREPLIHLHLFRHRPFVMGSLVALTYGTALFGSTYLLPVYMQLGLGLSASYVGTIMLPSGVVLAFTIAGVGRLADRQPPHRLVSTGLLLLAASFVLMLVLTRQSSLGWLVAWAILGRIGLGFILPSLNLGAIRGLPAAAISQGSSTISFVRSLGGAAGVSLCGIVLEWRLAAHGPGSLTAFNEVFVMLAALCGLATVAAWRLRVDERHRPNAQ